MAQEIADSKLLDTWGSSGTKIEPDISKIIEGWQLGEQPPHEYMNWLQNTFGSKLNHILKNGIAEWNNETEYLAGSSVQYSGNVWICETTNTNSEPTDLNANWGKVAINKDLTVTVDTLADLKNISYSANTVWASGYHTKNDGAFGSHIFRLKGVKTTETDNGGTVIVATIGGIDYVYELQYDGAVNVKWFGAKGDGVTNDTTNIESKLFVFDTIVFTKGTYLLGTLTFPNINIILEKGAILKPTSGSIITFGVLGENKVATINSGDYKIFDTTDGDISFISVNKINPLWFNQNYVGFSQTIRGYLAGHNAVNNSVDFNYTHIDGYRAGENITNSIEDLFVGTFAGSGVTSSYLSTAVGYGALRGEENPPGSGNFNPKTVVSTTAVGQGALQDGDSTILSVAVGSGAGKQIPVATSCTLIGANVARLGGDLSDVVLIGAGTAYSFGSTGVASDSQYTTMVGDDIGSNFTQGTRNTFIGARSALYATSGDDNTWLGYLTGPDSVTYPSVAASICIGSVARTRADNSITIGKSITNTLADSILIGDSGKLNTKITGIYNATTASAANVFIGSDNRLLRSTSSRDYKTDIEPVTDEWANKILELEPIFYKSTCVADNPDYGWYGFIAEDVAKVDPRFAIWAKEPLFDENGKPILDKETGHQLLGEEKPNGVAYDRMVVHLQKIIKMQEERLTSMESKIGEMLSSLNV